MKKIKKQLSLKRETIRTLNDEGLRRAAGGEPTGPSGSCNLCPTLFINDTCESCNGCVSNGCPPSPTASCNGCTLVTF
jgi:hypothetical protein